MFGGFFVVGLAGADLRFGWDDMVKSFCFEPMIPNVLIHDKFYSSYTKKNISAAILKPKPVNGSDMA